MNTTDHSSIGFVLCLMISLIINISTPLIDDISINFINKNYKPIAPLCLILQKHIWYRFHYIDNKTMRILLFWASWLCLVGELQQKKVFPRLTEAAVANSQENLHLIKNVPPLSLADSRAGLVSFELGCRSLAVTWEV